MGSLINTKILWIILITTKSTFKSEIYQLNIIKKRNKRQQKKAHEWYQNVSKEEK